MIKEGIKEKFYHCWSDNFPGASETFDNFFEITGKEPTRWVDFIKKLKFRTQ
jgi:hypothetical protein